MSQTRPEPRSRSGFGPPIAIQIIALLVAVLIIGQLATLAVVMILPPPRPPVYRIEDIAAALKGERTAPRYAPALIRSTSRTPLSERPGRDFRASALKAELGRVLGAPDEKVRLVIEPRSRFGFPFGLQTHSHMRPDDRPPPNDSLPAPPPPPSPSTLHPDGSAPAASAQPADDPDWLRHGGRENWYGFHSSRQMDRMGFIVGDVEAGFQTPTGSWSIVKSPPQGFPNAWQRRMVLWFLACLAVLTPVGYLFARRLTAPIRRFANAADQLGRGLRGPPMTLKGPAEIGVAATAFNEMQRRLARYVEDRTTMLGAIAHDLRTPLTRVQFKLQRAPADVAADIRTDLGQMEAMIAAVLAFVRDAAPAHERGPLDLMSLLEVVADDASATGADVQVEAGAAFIVDADASALQRLFVNLVDNAVKYGERARITLFAQDGEAVVQIADDGPGLSEDDRDRVFEPFYRVETSRSRDTGGIGLGLSIARSIARAHGGDVDLMSGAKGLTAVVRLPAAKISR